MGRLPDLAPIFYLALVGIVTVVVGAFAVIGWSGYHLFRALALYLGGTV